MRAKAARWEALAAQALDNRDREKCLQVKESYLSLAAMIERNARPFDAGR